MKVIKFKAQRSLHDSGYRHIKVEDEKGKSLGNYHDVIHLRIGNYLGSWLNIDCQKDGTFRIFCFPSPEGPDLDTEPYGHLDGASLFIDIKNVRLGGE